MMIHFKNGKLLWVWLTAAVIIITTISAFAVQWVQVNNNTEQIETNRIEVNNTFNNIEIEMKEQRTEINKRFDNMDKQFDDMGKALVKIETSLTYIKRDINELKEKVK